MCRRGSAGVTSITPSSTHSCTILGQFSIIFDILRVRHAPRVARMRRPGSDRVPNVKRLNIYVVVRGRRRWTPRSSARRAIVPASRAGFNQVHRGIPSIDVFPFQTSRTFLFVFQSNLHFCRLIETADRRFSLSDHSTGSFSFREPACAFRETSIDTFPFLG